MPGTNIVDSRLHSSASSCLYLQLNITDSLLGRLNGDTQKSPDFSLGFPEKEKDFSLEKLIILALVILQDITSQND
jgi:hypothetical protein